MKTIAIGALISVTFFGTAIAESSTKSDFTGLALDGGFGVTGQSSSIDYDGVRWIVGGTYGVKLT